MNSSFCDLIFIQKKDGRKRHMKIRLNEDEQIVKLIKQGLSERNGHCPCVREISDDTKCMCKQFREQIADPDLEDIYKVAPRERLRMALKNRPGDRAADFSFTTGKGGHGTLYGIDADYVLLFFHNLGCPACREVRQGIVSVTAREPAAGMLASGKLRIIALYPDTEINEKELYDLRAIPSLYLLDRDKKVILKDFVNPEMLSDALTYSEAD